MKQEARIYQAGAKGKNPILLPMNNESQHLTIIGPMPTSNGYVGDIKVQWGDRDTGAAFTVNDTTGTVMSTGAAISPK
jgi:hypothetical protein